MKKLLVAVLFLSAGFSVNAQKEKKVYPADEMKSEGKAVHKIIFQITTEDTLAHKALMKQLKNAFTLAPDAKLEVVCHGPGISMLVKVKSVVKENIAQIKIKGVEFVACEFTMKDRNITKDEIVP